MPDWRYDERRYIVQALDGEYFKEFESTGWETVKQSTIWTTDMQEAKIVSLHDLDCQGSIYPSLFFGFTNLKLIKIENHNIVN